MARKISITKDMISESAFIIAREEGLDKLTARRLADKTGCSTQPIFRIYENMESLEKEVFEQAMVYFSEFYESCRARKKTTDMPFVEFGLAYILFAMKEPHLFKMLFLSTKKFGRSLYELLNGTTGAFMKEMTKAKSLGVDDPGELFMRMWIFIHGAACMAITGDYDLSEQETIKLLNEMYHKNKVQ